MFSLFYLERTARSGTARSPSSARRPVGARSAHADRVRAAADGFAACARCAAVRPLVWCYAGLLVLGSLARHRRRGRPASCWRACLVGLPAGFMLATHGAGRSGAGRWAIRCRRCSCLRPSRRRRLPARGRDRRAPGGVRPQKLLPRRSAFALAPGCCRRAARREDVPGRLLVLRRPLGDGRSSVTRRHGTKKIIAGTARCSAWPPASMETFGSDPGMASTPTVLASLLLLVLFCIASLQLLGRRAWQAGDPAGKTGGAVDGPLDGVYRLAVLVMMAGFLFVPVLGSFGVPGEAIVLAGYLGLTFVLVSLFLVMAKITGQDAAVSFARGFAALYAGELAGIACGNGIELLEPAGQVPYAGRAGARCTRTCSCSLSATRRGSRAWRVRHRLHLRRTRGRDLPVHARARISAPCRSSHRARSAPQPGWRATTQARAAGGRLIAGRCRSCA